MNDPREDSDEKMDTASSKHSTPNSNSSDFEDATMNSLTTKMLETSINKNKCTLTLTTNHPLMGLASPDEKKDEKYDDSLSSIEADKNDYSLYSPQRNSSKSNLYVSEYVTAEFNETNSLFNGLKPRRKIKPNIAVSPGTPDNVISRFESRIGKRSTPKMEEEHFSEATEWCVSSSNVRPNFDLPMEMSSGINHVRNSHNSEIWSYDKSYVALMDVYTGSVALRQAVFNPPPKRKIQIPPLDDTCSIGSDCSIESEQEKDIVDPPSEDETQRSKSTATASECSDQIPEYSASEEYRDERSWLHVQHSGVNANCDMKVIEPFKRVISHGGYSADGAAIIVFSACYLPDNARPDYRYVMDNLFLYVIWSLERLVTDEYILVYLHGSAGKRRMPTFAWLHECYKLIDRRLRKNLKHLYLVHPTFWLKSFVVITKPFVSSKFFRKLDYVKTLDELFSKVPVEPNAIPESVKHFDIHRR